VTITIRYEAAARRMARSIVFDITLYNHLRIEAGDACLDAVQEGRELYLSRVAPEYEALYEDELEVARAGAKLPRPKDERTSRGAA
jgi:hypothetical protein